MIFEREKRDEIADKTVYKTTSGNVIAKANPPNLQPTKPKPELTTLLTVIS